MFVDFSVFECMNSRMTERDHASFRNIVHAFTCKRTHTDTNKNVHGSTFLLITLFRNTHSCEFTITKSQSRTLLSDTNYLDPFPPSNQVLCLILYLTPIHRETSMRGEKKKKAVLHFENEGQHAKGCRIAI